MGIKEDETNSRQGKQVGEASECTEIGQERKFNANC